MRANLASEMADDSWADVMRSEVSCDPSANSGPKRLAVMAETPCGRPDGITGGLRFRPR